MSTNKHILEKLDFVSGIVPINIGSARSSDVVSVKNHGRVAIVFHKAAGSASEDPTLTILQATSVAPSNAKALNFTDVFTKQGTLSSVGTWTKTTQASGNTYTNATASENEAVWVIDIPVDTLDVDNGFDCVQVTIADAGSVNQIASLMIIPHEPRYSKEGGISAIAN
jgi:hypothetical protein